MLASLDAPQPPPGSSQGQEAWRMAASSCSQSPGYYPMDSRNTPLGSAPGRGPAWGRESVPGFCGDGRAGDGQWGCFSGSKEPCRGGEAPKVSSMGHRWCISPPGPSLPVTPAPCPRGPPPGTSPSALQSDQPAWEAPAAWVPGSCRVESNVLKVRGPHAPGPWGARSAALRPGPPPPCVVQGLLGLQSCSQHLAQQAVWGSPVPWPQGLGRAETALGSHKLGTGQPLPTHPWGAVFFRDPRAPVAQTGAWGRPVPGHGSSTHSLPG